jgi:hypothetical protein
MQAKVIIHPGRKAERLCLEGQGFSANGGFSDDDGKVNVETVGRDLG